MYFHSLYYSLKVLIRDRAMVFWCLAFPIILGTMFYFAFGGLSEAESFSAIPVAVVQEETKSDVSLGEWLKALGQPGENQLLEITSCSSETEAFSLLEEKKVVGILTAKSPLTLTISREMTGSRLEQSILSSLVSQFNMNYEALKRIAAEHPGQLADALAALTEKVDYLNDTSFSEGNTSEALVYFFNLVAMNCLYAALAGNSVAVSHQANLSALGARKNISPVHKLISIFGGLTAAFLFQFASVFIGLCYMHFALSVDFGGQGGYVVLAAFAGCLCGVSLGFFVGSFGHGTVASKIGILISVIMVCCLLSGLMIGNMRMQVETLCPALNRINPAALISDALYALVVYPSHERYFTNIVTLIILSALFCLGGFFLVRRKKYASLSNFF